MSIMRQERVLGLIYRSTCSRELQAHNQSCYSMAGWSSQWCRAGVWEPRGVSAGLVVTQSYATAQSSARTGPPMGAGRTGETCGTGVPASTGWLGRCTVVSGGCCHWGRLAKGFMRSPCSWFSAASCDSIVISKSSVQKRDY